MFAIIIFLKNDEEIEIVFGSNELQEAEDRSNHLQEPLQSSRSRMVEKERIQVRSIRVQSGRENVRQLHRSQMLPSHTADYISEYG